MYEISNDDDDDDDDDDEDDDGEFDEQTCGCVSLVVHLATTNCESNTFPGIIMTMMMMTMIMMIMIMMAMIMIMMMNIKDNYDDFGLVVMKKRSLDDKSYEQYKITFDDTNLADLIRSCPLQCKHPTCTITVIINDVIVIIIITVQLK